MIQRLALLLLLVLAACSDETIAPDDYPLPEGLHAALSVGAENYDLEVAQVEGATAVLRYHWRGRLVSERTQYRGLYSLSGFEDSREFSNDIDTAAIDALFPLAVGKETSFSGITRYPAAGIVGKLWVTMSVVDKERLSLEGASFDVFVIPVTTEFRIDGRSSKMTRTLYYAPDLGIPLKIDMSDGENRLYWRITSLDMPPVRGRRNRLGTVMI